MDYAKKAIRGAGIVFIFSILAAFCGYLLRLLLARNLTVEEYGLFYAAFALVAFLSAFKDLGLNQALVKFIAEFDVKKRYDLIKNTILHVFWIRFIFSGIIAFILILLSDYLAINYFRSEAASLVLKLLVLAFWFDSFEATIGSSFRGFQRMGYRFSIDLVRILIILSISFVGLKLGKGILSPAVAYAVVPLITSVIYLPILVKKIFPRFLKEKFKINKDLTKKLFAFGIPVILVGLSGLILQYTDTILLTYFTSLEDVGLYNVALPTANVLMFFSIALAAVMLPLSSELWTRKYKKQLIEGIKILYKYCFVIIIPLSLVIFSFPTLTLSILFGSNYAAASPALMILIMGVLFLTITNINFNVLSGIGKPRITAKIITFAAIFNLIFNFILIPVLGIVGAAITTLSGYSIMMVLSIIALRKFIKIPIPMKNWVKTLILSGIFALLVYFLKIIFNFKPWKEAIIIISIAGALYILLLFIFKIVNVKEIKQFKKYLY